MLSGEPLDQLVTAFAPIGSQVERDRPVPPDVRQRAATCGAWNRLSKSGRLRPRGELVANRTKSPPPASIAATWAKTDFSVANTLQTGHGPKSTYRNRWAKMPSAPSWPRDAGVKLAREIGSAGGDAGRVRVGDDHVERARSRLARQQAGSISTIRTRLSLRGFDGPLGQTVRREGRSVRPSPSTHVTSATGNSRHASSVLPLPNPNIRTRRGASCSASGKTAVSTWPENWGHRSDAAAIGSQRNPVFAKLELHAVVLPERVGSAVPLLRGDQSAVVEKGQQPRLGPRMALDEDVCREQEPRRPRRQSTCRQGVRLPRERQSPQRRRPPANGRLHVVPAKRQPRSGGGKQRWPRRRSNAGTSTPRDKSQRAARYPAKQSGGRSQKQHRAKRPVPRATDSRPLACRSRRADKTPQARPRPPRAERGEPPPRLRGSASAGRPVKRSTSLPETNRSALQRAPQGAPVQNAPASTSRQPFGVADRLIRRRDKTQPGSRPHQKAGPSGPLLGFGGGEQLQRQPPQGGRRHSHRERCEDRPHQRGKAEADRSSRFDWP